MRPSRHEARRSRPAVPLHRIRRRPRDALAPCDNPTSVRLAPAHACPRPRARGHRLVRMHVVGAAELHSEAPSQRAAATRAQSGGAVGAARLADGRRAPAFSSSTVMEIRQAPCGAPVVVCEDEWQRVERSRRKPRPERSADQRQPRDLSKSRETQVRHRGVTPPATTVEQEHVGMY